MKKRGLLYVPTSLEEAAQMVKSARHGRRHNIVSPYFQAEITAVNKEAADYQTKNGFLYERSSYGAVRAFFDEAAADYDSDLANPYWAFSHEILKFLLEKFIGQHFGARKRLNFLDAGAGTGNWSNFILGISDEISATLFDMNPYMLECAYKKVVRHGVGRSKIIEGNLEIFTDLPSQQFDLITCMHNVIGMARDTKAVLQNLCRKLDTNGVAFIMAMNKYHAFNFNHESHNEREVQRVLKDSTVKFKEDMPEMFCYTPLEFDAILKDSGFQEVVVLGYPVTVYPSAADTKLLHTRATETLLRNPAERRHLLEIEKRLCLLPELAYRGGSSLIAICSKPSVV